jgi:hypothetical protein
MNTPESVTIFKGTYGDYYEMCGIHYDANFPTNWAKEHDKKETKYGPIKCFNCFYFGHYQGVFVGYCLNCAEHLLNYERGYGLQDEFCNENESIDNIAAPLNSMWYKYMNNLPLFKIGDKKLHEKIQKEKDEKNTNTKYIPLQKRK